jgi:hypothetical protein
MLPREDFIFTIGYDGPVAVIDKQAKNKYGKLSTRELVEKGFYRAAYSSAVYSGNTDDIKFVSEAYYRLIGNSSGDFSGLERLFGVSLVDVKRSILL